MCDKDRRKGTKTRGKPYQKVVSDSPHWLLLLRAATIIVQEKKLLVDQTLYSPKIKDPYSILETVDHPESRITLE